MEDNTPTPKKEKPFIVANVKEVFDRYESEEISFSRMVEIMNEMVFKWVKPLEEDSKKEIERRNVLIEQVYKMQSKPGAVSYWQQFKIGNNL